MRQRLLVLLHVAPFFLLACGDDDSIPAKAADAGRDSASVSTPTPTPTTTSTSPTVTPVPVDCPLGTTVETEPNDKPSDANAVGDLAFCGALTPGSDVDYSTFATPAGKKLTLFQAVVEGQVDFELAVGGSTLKPTDTRSFVAGTYVVRAFTKDGTPGKYRYRVQYAP